MDSRSAPFFLELARTAPHNQRDAQKNRTEVELSQHPQTLCGFAQFSTQLTPWLGRPLFGVPTGEAPADQADGRSLPDYVSTTPPSELKYSA